MTFGLVSLVSSYTQKQTGGKPSPPLPARGFLPTPPRGRIRRPPRRRGLARRALPTPRLTPLALLAEPGARVRLGCSAPLSSFVRNRFVPVPKLSLPEASSPRRPPRAAPRPTSPGARLPAARCGRPAPVPVPPPGPGAVPLPGPDSPGSRRRPQRPPAPRPQLAPRSRPRGDAPCRPSPRRPHRMPLTGAARGAPRRPSRGPGPPARPPGRPTHPMSQSMAARDPPRPPPDTLGPQPAAAAEAGSKHSLAHSHARVAGAAGSDAGAPPAGKRSPGGALAPPAARGAGAGLSLSSLVPTCEPRLALLGSPRCCDLP